MTDARQRIIDYYHTRESVWGYPLILGGAKHFGYYPPEISGLSMRQSLRIMEEILGRTIGLPRGVRVLDAGCGMGRVAGYLAKHFGHRVDGVDLLDFNITSAKRFASREDVASQTNFQTGDYTRLPFSDHTFDAVYTMETLVHAPDVSAALAEFRRVLKPGGRLVNFEYSITPITEMESEAARVFRAVIDGTAMHALPEFTHDSFPTRLESAGFTAVSAIDITDRIMPMWRRFSRIAAIPYAAFTRTNLPQHRYINAMAAVEWIKHPGHFRYNLVASKKAK